ncbi:MAG: histidine kinase [Bifidobacteriaceae bacterium]|nr:histidine kinase [Bifidobacteriaceae bacterium]
MEQAGARRQGMERYRAERQAEHDRLGALGRAVPPDVLAAVIGLISVLDPDELLPKFAREARVLTGATAAAINILDVRGRSEQFIVDGDDPAALAAARGLENTQEALSLLRDDEPLVFPAPGPGPATKPTGIEIPPSGPEAGAAVPEHGPARFRYDHPDVFTLIGTPVKVRGGVYAHLYLINKPGGFQLPDVAAATALAAAAGVGIGNAQAYQTAQHGQEWLTAGQEITTMMLSGADEEDALSAIAARARQVAGADTCVLILPSLENRLVMEIADGAGAKELIGTVMPRDGRSQTVLNEGIGMIVDSFSHAFTLRVQILRNFGPALYAPLITDNRGIGVMLLMRHEGGPAFHPADLATAEAFAAQAAMVLVLAEARHTQDVKQLLDERERIARDLHDLAIQQLFATGMQLETARARVAEGADPGDLQAVLVSAIDNVDDSVKQIRSIVHGLRDPDADVSLAERLRREASNARTSLGFAPSLVIIVDGETVGAGRPDLEDHLDQFVDPDLADDVVAVVREGLSNVARHAHAASVQVTVAVRGPEAPAETQPEDGPQRGRRFAGGQVRIEVRDDGVGISEQATRSSGLENLAGRARRHRGKLRIEPGADGRGTSMVWRAPLGQAGK